ncbi:ATP12 family chaperone protein [Aestuariivirga sp.]|uniref:ATP12 family chaperone protein n=1 Tax=Aestuariivirga sp. TaxID=2650926 RepID=UPI003BADBDCF
MTAKRRFYKTVTVTDDLGIALDGRAVKTPLRMPLVLPTRALADAVAAEWEAQEAEIKPSTMVFTKLANTAIDRVQPDRARIEAEVLDYANSDLVCYRADRPPELVERQTLAWDPVVDWARITMDAPFDVAEGVIHRAQPASALAAFGLGVTELNDFQLAAFHTLMTLTGSALITMMLVRGAAIPEAAWLAAHVDEDYQIELWGQDHEAQARRLARYTEFMACCRFLELARG